VSSPLPSVDLMALYKIAIDEYRFEVKLNWDRTVYYLTLNSGILAIATGLLKAGSEPIIDLLVAGVFVIGVCTTIVGAWSIRQGHQYYRRTILKKTIIEDYLGLTKGLDEYPNRPTLSIGTTMGQGDYLEILRNPDQYLARPLRRRSISFFVQAILIVFCVANLGGIGISVWLFRHPNIAVPASSVTPNVKIRSSSN
jgi:hypothetical protein